MEGAFAKKEFKRCNLRVPFYNEIRICHGDLIVISEQWCDDVIVKCLRDIKWYWLVWHNNSFEFLFCEFLLERLWKGYVNFLFVLWRINIIIIIIFIFYECSTCSVLGVRIFCCLHKDSRIFITNLKEHSVTPVAVDLLNSKL